jgi:Ca2+-binding EF-hand superfamily protein
MPMFRPPVSSAALLALCFVILIGTDSPARGQTPAGKLPAPAQGPGAKQPSQEHRRRPAHVISILIETSRFDPEAREELQMIYDALRKLDKDNNGKIDASELDAARQQLIEGRADHILKKLAKSKTDRISRDEAQGPIKEHFDQIDTNRDGYIDRNELIQAMTRAVKTEGANPPAKK